MPELPEVETIRRDLESEIIGLHFTAIKFLWTGSLKGISPSDFEKQVIGPRISGVRRRAKSLIIDLDSSLSLLMHMKMTGHLLIEPASVRFDENGNWLDKKAALSDPLNQFIRVVFWLGNGKIMAFSDLRKFGYIKLVTQAELNKFLDDYGPEPFSNDFSPEYLVQLFGAKKQAIKKVLMDQKNIAGIGNIYADEILWATKIHPETPANKLSNEQIEDIYNATREILQKSIKLRGTSTSDYRDTRGEKGKFEGELKAYKRTGLPCPRCQTSISRISVGGRGTHYCPKCQIKGIS